MCNTFRKYIYSTLVLILSLCAYARSDCLTADFSKDYTVGWDDFSVMTGEWLIDSFYPESYRLFPSDGGNTFCMNPYDFMGGSKNFGCAVATRGEYIIVGAIGDNFYAGSAYIYKFNATGQTWAEQAKITASDGRWYDQFGWSVSICGDYCVVGAPCDQYDDTDDDPYDYAGAAYIFKRDLGGENNWGQLKKLVTSPRIGGGFGCSVLIDGNYIIVGGAGQKAYIYKKDEGGTDNWGEITTLQSTVPLDEDEHFGTSVDISSDFVIVGAPGNDRGRRERDAAT